ncbi:hypothetical protein QFZ99_006080 [Paraburkholderia atlantica]|uniref:hypothetical protein n=1 Tax=Paraburkholderia atlantica TaxID=2654982 RepID=UPI003D1AC32C
MKIIAAVRIGRYGVGYKPGDVLDVSEREAAMYVRSRQATYATQPATAVKPKPKPQAGTKRPERETRESARDTPERATTDRDDTDDTERRGETARPRKGRYRRRDMKAGDA